MALEDLTGTKYINSLVITNPTSQDQRAESAGHLRGIKNVSKLSFPNVSEPVLATDTELNLMVGETGSAASFAAGTACYFYQAAAPTGWTQETVLANLDGSTVRIETGTGGGAVSGTDDLASPPTTAHTHSDTLAGASYTMTTAHMPVHDHLLWDLSTNEDSTPERSTIYANKNYNRDSNNAAKHYSLDSAAVTANICVTGYAGGGGSHIHSLNGSVSTSADYRFYPRYLNVILCERD